MAAGESGSGAQVQGPGIEPLMAAARAARARLAALTQAQVDALVRAMTLSAIEQSISLAGLAAREGGGDAGEAGVTRQLHALEQLYERIRPVRTAGLVGQNVAEDWVETATPLGILVGVPSDRAPVFTIIFQALLAAKTRNPIIFAVPPAVQRCATATLEVLRAAALAAGAPAGSIGWTHPGASGPGAGHSGDSGPGDSGPGAALAGHPAVSRVLVAGQSGGMICVGREGVAASGPAAAQAAAVAAALRQQGLPAPEPQEVEDDPAAWVRHLVSVRRAPLNGQRTRWFKILPQIYFEPGSLSYLGRLPGARALIVTDLMMVRLGYVERAIAYLERRGIQVAVFADVEPDPSIEMVRHATAALNDFQADIIVALGGGSPIDVAKAARVLYEHPDLTEESLRAEYSDIRRRAMDLPTTGRRAAFVAIPTTSGTGSEVSAFSVITDRATGLKYPLADFEMTPDIALIDPELVYTVPPAVTADTGIDVLTHAIEALVSVAAQDCTDALAQKAVELVFAYLPAAYADSSDERARAKVHYASTLAGMAFTNAFLGINHSLAHALGARFHIPHGRANGILLPHVIAFNAARPGGEEAGGPSAAAERYADIARRLGLPAATTAAGVASLIQAIRDLAARLHLPLSVAEAGVSREAYLAALPAMAEAAASDPCTVSNPRRPRTDQLADLLRAAYGPA